MDEHDRENLEITLNTIRLMDELHSERRQEPRRPRPAQPLLVGMADMETLIRKGVLRDEISGEEREV